MHESQRNDCLIFDVPEVQIANCNKSSVVTDTQWNGKIRFLDRITTKSNPIQHKQEHRSSIACDPTNLS
ncbi:unnamed protein product [Rotaria socialis]